MGVVRFCESRLLVVFLRPLSKSSSNLPPTINSVNRSIFLLQLLLVIGVLFYSWDSNPDFDMVGSNMSKMTVLGMFLLSATIAALLSAGWFLLVRAYPHSIVQYTYYATIAGMLSIGAASFAYENYGWSRFWALAGFSIAAYYYVVMTRVPFATLMIEAAVHVISLHPEVLIVAAVGYVVQVLWFLLWVYTYIHAWPLLGHNYVVMFFLMGSLLWTSQVISNVVFCISSSVTATWYFLYDCMPENPTTGATYRTLTIVSMLQPSGMLPRSTLLTSLHQTNHLYRVLALSLSGPSLLPESSSCASCWTH